MSEHASHNGVCPACHRSGRIGHLCDHGPCAKAGLHFIPESFVVRGPGQGPLVGRMIDSHLLVERLHRPGVDVAYEGFQFPALLPVEVALALPEREPEVHDNLFRQARALGRLGSHPNITQLVLFGAGADGTYLITPSRAAARTLADVVTPEGNEPVGSAAARILLDPLCAALAALSKAQLVHGEIRPEHVLVYDEPGYDAFVRLGGFVRIPPLEGQLRFPTHEAVWRPPEQIFQHAVGPTTDAYAVAGIAFALLFGRPPFPADDRDALAEAKRDPSYDVTEGIAASVPAVVTQFFQNALAYDPAERYSGDSGFQHALDAALQALAAAESGAAEPAEEERPSGVASVRMRALREPPMPEPHPPREPPVREPPMREPVRREPVRREPAMPEPVRDGRPPRFHRDRPEPPRDLEPERPEPRHEEHVPQRHGSTQVLNVNELEDLASRRGPPRMHKKTGPGES